MIHVLRPSVAPAGLIAAAAREMDQYRAFIKDRRKRKLPAKEARHRRCRSESFNFKAYRLRAVKDTLEVAFHCKCAYCDSDYGAVANVRVEHFRPKGRVDREGMKSLRGYYWLAAEWSNLLPSCERCNSPKKDFIPALSRRETVGKANWFPLWDEKKRAIKQGHEKREYPLLLNPCRDDPERYLIFDEDGMVKPAARLSKREKTKAEESIRLYGLGRLRLVKARHEHAKRVLGHIRLCSERYDDWLVSHGDAELRRRLCRAWEDLEQLLMPDVPYRALTKQLIARHVTVAMHKKIERLRRAR